MQQFLQIYLSQQTFSYPICNFIKQKQAQVKWQNFGCTDLKTL